MQRFARQTLTAKKNITIIHFTFFFVTSKKYKPIESRGITLTALAALRLLQYVYNWCLIDSYMIHVTLDRLICMIY